jgi:hypothetical protein
MNWDWGTAFGLVFMGGFFYLAFDGWRKDVLAGKRRIEVQRVRQERWALEAVEAKRARQQRSRDICGN